MDRTIPAIFASGVFRPLEPVDLAEGTQVEIQVPLPALAPGLSNTDDRDAWSEFIAQTYGSCAGLGLDRSEQGEYEIREPLS
jgi:predicted DNA-binding antitoxin AbrB/MazE fold protein